jgi:hypothetical protein
MVCSGFPSNSQKRVIKKKGEIQTHVRLYVKYLSFVSYQPKLNLVIDFGILFRKKLRAD